MDLDVDKSAPQDVPPCEEGNLGYCFCLSLVKPGSAIVSLSALEKDVDFLPMARSVVQLTTWGSVLFWQPSGGRSLTVLTEERDASPLDLLIVSEACEIGELGNEETVNPA